MPETDRTSITSLAIVPAQDRTPSGVGGDYMFRSHVLDSALVGAYQGELIGLHLCVYLLGCLFEPDLVAIEAAVGAVSMMSAAVLANEIQEFRDELARSLEKAAITPFNNDVLANYVYSYIKDIDYTDTKVIAATAPLPANTNSVLLIKIEVLEIRLDGKYATFETEISASLRNVSSGAIIRSSFYSYTDRDTLTNWGDNDSALVAAYLSLALHYFGQAIAADFLHKVELRHVLRPLDSDSVSGMGGADWRGRATSDSPTLAWELILLGDDPYGRWTLSLDEDDIEYELQIFDWRSLVYRETQIVEPVHQLETSLDDCTTLRWTVRPHYTYKGKTRVGQWMRYHSDISVESGNIGNEASVEPAYLKGLPTLDTRCGES